MTQEQKAKAYDEAIRIAQELYNNPNSSNIGKGYVCTVFPELQESEDERVRESLLEYLHTLPNHYSHSGVCAPEWIAWLEKQGEPVEINPTEFDTRLQALIGKFDSLPKEELIGSLSFWLNVVQNDGTYKPAKKQDEQTPIQDYNSIDPHFCKPVEHKPADKVEPKFKVGNWVVHDMSDGRKVIRQIVNMTNKSYVLDGEDFNTFYFNDLENDYHLWTINDAKPGDILAIEPIDDYQYPFVAIYKERGLDFFTFNSYCFIGFSGIFYGGKCGHRTNVHPATKEQRDILFEKMKEAGYEWNTEKKELNEIEQKPVNSYCRENCKGFQETGKCFADGYCKAKNRAESIDEVEPKFKIGDWITNGDYIWKIIEVEPLDYILQSQDGNIVDDTISNVDEQFHSFTIEDAKEGDVLSYVTDEEDLWIMIYWSLYEPYEGHVHYHALLANDNFYDKGTCCICINDLKPVTKEQRDLLFQKMKEAGYEWDAEKKELKKIENRPMLSDFFNAEYERGKADAISEIQKGWTEDDKNHMSNILNILLMEAKNAKVEQYRSSVESDIDWIYSLKNKVRVQPKQEWSKWDELQYKAAYNLCENSGHTVTSDWLKSIKQRIGG